METKLVKFRPQTERFREMLLRAGPKERAVLLEMHAFYAEQFRAALAGSWQPEGMAAGLHDQCDEAMAELMKRPRADEVKCRKGCAHCCRLQVDITEQEAKLLLHAAHEAGLSIDHERLGKQARAHKWNDLPPADRACVFLDDAGACSVYEHRPTACRKYLVISDPDQCDTLKHPGRKVLNFVSPDAEAAHSAAFEVFDAERMASMLLQVMG